MSRRKVTGANCSVKSIRWNCEDAASRRPLVPWKETRRPVLMEKENRALRLSFMNPIIHESANVVHTFHPNSFFALITCATGAGTIFSHEASRLWIFFNTSAE